MKQSVDKIKSIIHLDRDEYLIRYRLSYLCNYKCKGCYQDPDRLLNNKAEYDLIAKIIPKINHIIETLPTDKPITLYLEGGEVSLFDIQNLVLSKLNLNRIHTLKLVTNLSAPLSYYTNLLDFLKLYNIIPRWQVSFHLGQCNPDDFFNKVKQLPIHMVLVVVDNQNYLQYKPYLQQMLSDSIRFTVNPKKYDEPINEETNRFIADWNTKLNNNFYKVAYTDGETELLDQYQVKQFFNAVKFGATCSHRKNIAINPDGTIYFFCGRSKPLGNIIELTDTQLDMICAKMQTMNICMSKGACSFNCGGIDIYIND